LDKECRFSCIGLRITKPPKKEGGRREREKSEREEGQVENIADGEKRGVTTNCWGTGVGEHMLDGKNGNPKPPFATKADRNPL